MIIKEAWQRWWQRHQSGPNRILHGLGIPATIVGVVLLFVHLWWLAALCFVAGYVLQVIGHYLEGSRVGEVILLKKVFLPSGSFAKRLATISVLAVGGLAAGLIIQIAITRNVYSNFYETVGVGMYRSGQLPAKELGEAIGRHKIKTVVNLRAGADEPWYQAEREVIDASAARMIYFPLVASEYPDPKELSKLVEIVNHIKPPFLVHCNGGADRTGLFFVLLALRQGQSWSEAMGQLSLLRFGYCSLTRSAAVTCPLYDFDDYAGKHDVPRDFEHFWQWLRSDDAQETHRRWLDEQGLPESR